MSELPQVDPNAPLSGAASTINPDGLLAVVWTCFTVATLFVTLRLGVRWRQNHKFLPDDYWIIWAWACLLTMAILQTQQMDALWYTTYLSSGRIPPIPEEIQKQTTQLTRWQFPIIKLFWVVLWSVKASFMAVFYRLVQPFPLIRRLWYCVAVFTFLAFVGCVVASTLTCSPPSDYFYGSCTSPEEEWRSRFNVLYSTTVDVATDLMIMALPIAVLPSLQLDKRKKIGLGIAFSLGVIIICVAIVRMTQVIVGTTVDLVGLAVWGAVETATAIVVGSLPPLKALMSRSVREFSSKKSSQRYGTDKSSGNKTYGPAASSRNVMVSESIPLDDLHHSAQHNGGIYVQKTFDSRVMDGGSSSRDSDEDAAIARPPNAFTRCGCDPGLR